MKPVLLIDFGSTYTKVTAVDVDAPAILGTAGAHTTIRTDIGDGLQDALALLHAQTGPLDYVARYACSSAAGGLRMVACGLVPSLTVEAAKRAALGAGAKIVKVYSYQLTDEDIAEIGGINPDILLLTGGTDGGNRENIVQNAGMLKRASGRFPIVIAGNRAAAKECVHLLEGSGHETLVCENVMPIFNKLNVEPVQAVIRDLFLRRIVHAKGLSHQQALLDGILMPTPSAVMRALELLSGGIPGQRGMGDLVAADLGGATTDIYSIADGLPSGASTILRGLPEPHAKRTVEGDIGMRYSAQGVVEAAGLARLSQISGLDEEKILALLDTIATTPGILPVEGDDLSRLDRALASTAIATALIRHAGTLEQIYTPTGAVYQQTGKDLTRVETLLLTGGALVHSGHAQEIADYALACKDEPLSLKPRSARILVDRHYILAAMGLLSEPYPTAAFTILQNELLMEDKGA